MNMHPNCTTVPRASYPEFTQTDTQYIIKGNISSLGGDYVAVNYYPYTRDNGENYYTFTLYRIWGDTSCYFALFEVTLHEISEPNSLRILNLKRDTAAKYG